MVKKEEALKLLIVEDNMGDYVLVNEYFMDVFQHSDLTHVSKFSEAKKLLEENKREFDAILLDLTLPDLSGEELVDEMLTIAGEQPVIVLTGYSDLSFSIESLAKGVSDYLLKDELSPPLLHKSILYSIERHAYASRIRLSEKNYRQLFELSPQPMMLFELDTFQFLDVNKSAVIKYGYSKEEFLNMTLMDIKPEQEVEESKKVIFETEDQIHITFGKDYRHITKSGKEILVEIHASTVYYQGKRVRMALAHDVTQKRKEEVRLKLLESVITNTNESVVILEAKPTEYSTRKILYVNKAFTETTDYREEEVLNKPLTFLYGEDTDMDKVEKVKQKMNNWEICTVEIIGYKKGTEPFWINTSFVPVADEKGNYTHWIGIARDVTEKVKSDRELKKSLAEKEVLLSEIHHRVKNNLAIVSGMMYLQAFREENSELEKKLMDSVLRIRTMASIHELLYESDSFSKVNFTKMVNKLSSDLENTMNDSKKVGIQLSQEDIELNINQAIPCALMLNEVLTNAYKHAFRGKEGGTIDILIEMKQDTVHVEVKDDGIGIGIHEPTTLGMQLIQILTKQLEGDYSYSGSKDGTIFRLNFIKKEVKGAASSSVV